jgi:hypothetical protein
MSVAAVGCETYFVLYLSVLAVPACTVIVSRVQREMLSCSVLRASFYISEINDGATIARCDHIGLSPSGLVPPTPTSTR